MNVIWYSRNKPEVIGFPILPCFSIRFWGIFGSKWTCGVKWLNNKSDPPTYFWLLPELIGFPIFELFECFRKVLSKVHWHSKELRQKNRLKPNPTTKSRLWDGFWPGFGSHFKMSCIWIQKRGFWLYRKISGSCPIPTRAFNFHFPSLRQGRN